MAVGIQGHGYGCVTQELLHELRVHAASQQQGGTCVPKIMKSYLRQAGPLKKRFEGSLDEVLRVEGRAFLSGEDQVLVLVQAG